MSLIFYRFCTMCLGVILLYLLSLGFTVIPCLWIHIFHHTQKIHIIVRIPEGMNRENQERNIGDVAVVCTYHSWIAFCVMSMLSHLYFIVTIFLFLQVLILFTKIPSLFLMASRCFQMFSLKNHFKHNDSVLSVL